VWSASSLVFARDGRSLFVGSSVPSAQFAGSLHECRAVAQFGVPSGRLLAECGDQAWGSHQLALSPDGKTLASVGGDGSVELSDVAARRPVRRLEVSGRVPRPVAWSPDGAVVAVGGEDIKLWRAADGKLAGRLGEGHVSAYRVAFAPDGRLLVTADRDGPCVRLWDVSTGKTVARLKAGRCPNVAFAPDGRTLAADGEENGSVHLWQVPSGKLQRTLKGPGHRTRCLAFAPDGKALAAGFDTDELRVWVLDGPEKPQPLAWGPVSADAVAFSPDGKVLASGGRQGKVQLWDAATGKELYAAGGHRGAVCSLAYAPDGQTLASASYWDQTVRLWAPAEGRPLRQWTQSDDPFLIRFTAGGKRLLSTSVWQGGRMHLWETATGKELLAFPYQERPVLAAGESPAGAVVSASWAEGGTLRRWDASTGKQLAAARLPCDPGGPHHVALSRDARLLACGTGSAVVHLFDIPAWKAAGQVRLGTGEIVGPIAVSDRHLFAASSVGTVHLGELAAGKEVWNAQVGLAATCVGFSATGRLAAAGGQDCVEVFEVCGGGEVARFAGAGSGVECLAFAPDGRSLACGYRDTTILIWDLTGGRPVTRGGGLRWSSQEQQQLWADLESSDAGRAYRAVFRLVDASDRAVALLESKLRPAKVAADQIEAWVADLDSPDYALRERAQRALEGVGDQAAPALRRAAAGPPSVEVKRRVRDLLAELNAEVRRQRESRVAEVLEHIATPEARRVLQTLATGEPRAHLTQEARASLDRLAKRP
jgi:WD40 repeat protein